jgi:hypothetical protein
VLGFRIFFYRLIGQNALRLFGNGTNFRNLVMFYECSHSNHVLLKSYVLEVWRKLKLAHVWINYTRGDIYIYVCVCVCVRVRTRESILIQSTNTPDPFQQQRDHPAVCVIAQQYSSRPISFHCAFISAGKKIQLAFKNFNFFKFRFLKIVWSRNLELSVQTFDKSEEFKRPQASFTVTSSFIQQFVSRHVQSLFQSELSTQCFLELPPSDESILSFS